MIVITHFLNLYLIPLECLSLLNFIGYDLIVSEVVVSYWFRLLEAVDFVLKN